MQPKDLFTLSRVLITIFSVSVWHQQINETISNGTLDANNCRLMSPLFFTVLFIHFIYNTTSFFYLKREFVLWYSLVNILVGAFIVMSLKPNQWFYSFKWSDCNELYNNNDVIGRFAMLSYVLITLGSVELLLNVLLFKENIWSLVKCNGFESEFEVQFEWGKFWFLTSVFLVLFILCTIMVAAAGGFA